jgi:hypothetical protein
VKNIFSNRFCYEKKKISFFFVYLIFSRRVLQISNGVEHVDGLAIHLVVALAVAWIICFLALSKGVQSLGKVKLIRLEEKENLFYSLKYRSLILLLYFLM